MEETGPLGTVAGIADWYNHCGKRFGDSSHDQKHSQLPYDPAIVLPGIHAKKTKALIQKFPGTPAALLRQATDGKNLRAHRQMAA